VRYCSTAALLCLGLFAWLPLTGCGRSADGLGGPPTAALSDSVPGDAPGAGKGLADSPPPRKPSTDPLHPVVLVETSRGALTIELDAEKAPLTVQNFLSYVRASYYDGTIIHQVYRGQGIVAGGYDAKGVAKIARTPIRNEAENGLKNRRGAVAMVRQPGAIDSATSEFLVNVADNQALDFRDRTPEGYGYCVFGRVIEGMDVVDKINQAPVHDTTELDRTPVERIVVKSIRRIR
jgi:cyclophilin family peptidyl-prolyl cis-trans isomerase